MIVRNTSNNTCKKINIYRFSGEYRPYLVHWRGPDCMKARKRSWYDYHLIMRCSMLRLFLLVLFLVARLNLT